jgi:transketolase
LGQGFGDAVGMALAEKALSARYNRPGHSIVDHYTYVLASDGDMMEGVSSEAASLAGHLRLGKLIVVYSDNHVSIEGNTELAFSEDVPARFRSYGWHAKVIDDATDLDALSAAFAEARAAKDRPSLIAVRTHIGYGSPHKQDSAEAHGEPLGEEEAGLTKERLGWPRKPPFYIPDEALAHFRKAVSRGEKAQSEWRARFEAYAATYPQLAGEFDRTLRGELPPDWSAEIPVFSAKEGPLATRGASEKVINGIAPRLPELIGGSADLAPSTKTLIKEGGDFEAKSSWGRNLHFGVREHGMGTILNGMALHKGLMPYGATFLIFSDYMRPPMRLAAMNGLHVIYVFTHDSIGLGEDGPTHQPVEQLLGLRAIPGMTVIRPADANETALAWKIAIRHSNGPVALVLTRQKLPVLDTTRYGGLSSGVYRGGYVLETEGDDEAVLIATGSEVHVALGAQARLKTEGYRARVVSLPCWKIFEEQTEEYRSQVLPEELPWLAIEAGTPLGWSSYLGPSRIEVVGIETFGASAPGQTVMDEFGFNAENVCSKARRLIDELRSHYARRSGGRSR